ncbi:MAG: peptidoglycan editing factor PgeF [Candidatus Sericytochromatia bacterium]|nr:peptidoglycan editing factor PgeF [Candidatus Sericytochromatia bacterium]
MPSSFRRIERPGAPAFLRCDALTATHAFSLRHGGCSSGPWESLNLGASAGDAPECVVRNKQIWADSFEITPPPLTLHQIHGATVYEVTAHDNSEPGFHRGDALVNAMSDRAVGVYTADCVPILLSTMDGRVVSAAHAGWRGTAAEVVLSALDGMCRFGVHPSEVVVAVGPAIGPCCFAVGQEVIAAFSAQAWYRPSLVHQVNGHTTVDLVLANRLQLEAAGIAAQNIHASEMCTSCLPSDFFSWRRDKGQTGRHLAMIQRRSPGL